MTRRQPAAREGTFVKSFERNWSRAVLVCFLVYFSATAATGEVDLDFDLCLCLELWLWLWLWRKPRKKSGDVANRVPEAGEMF
mmetsp:Transcript_31735/g.67438  ORF Transcript_31735/g.67438 Transcript_31735/m.67438 type:complete len:83 (+) Transcript_31735:176-424(+)